MIDKLLLETEEAFSGEELLYGLRLDIKQKYHVVNFNHLLVSKNQHLQKLSDETIIDLFTAGLGGYCGSFVVPTTEAERYIFALNTIDKLLISGKTSSLYRIASMRE